MKCLNCGKDIDNNLVKCTYCNHNVVTKSNSRKRKKKIDNSDVSLDKTIAITGLVDESSLLDDFYNQIDKVNEEANIDNNVKKVILPIEDDEVEILNTTRSFKDRRRVLVTCALISLLIVIFMVSVYVGMNYYNNSKKDKIDYLTLLDTEMEEYYKTSETDDLVDILNDIKDDSKKVIKYQEKVNEIANKWLEDYKEVEVNSKKEFEDITFKYKDLIDGLYRYVIISNGEIYLRALNVEDYDKLILIFDTIYKSSDDYYTAIDLYNDKDYNKAYYMFSKIDNTSSYYKKAIKYNEKIITNILELLKKDIRKIENGIDELSNEEKFRVYIAIEETIYEYDNVYTIDLSTNSEYNTLLNKYTTKVNEYSDLVAKE